MNDNFVTATNQLKLFQASTSGKQSKCDFKNDLCNEISCRTLAISIQSKKTKKIEVNFFFFFFFFLENIKEVQHFFK